LEFLRSSDGISTITCFPYDVDAWFCRQKGTKPIPNDGMIIDNEDSNRIVFFPFGH
jgi:hypothetical protein